MKISKIVQILIMLLLTTTYFAQVVEVTDDLSLNDAIVFVEGGGATEILLTTDGGVYYTKPFVVETVPIVIKAAPGLAVKPMIVTQNSGAGSFIVVKNDLKLDGIKLNGYDAATGIYDSVKYAIHVEALEGSANEEPDIIITNCEFTNIYKNGDPEFSKDGNILDFTKGARGGTILLENCMFSNTGDEALRSINTHKDPVPKDGKFCNSFIVRNSTFSNIRGTGIKIEGDGDSTNTDPQIVMENLTFDSCQRRVIWHRQMFSSVIRDILITNSIKGNDDFSKSQALITYQGFGTTVSHIDTFNIQGVKANGDTVTLEYGTFVPEPGSHDGSQRLPVPVDESTVFNFDPGYADAANGDYTLASNSPLLSLGHDGLAIGDRNWAGQLVTDIKSNISKVPSSFKLSQNYPNPFNPTTQIQFSIPSSGNFSLKVYNILGQEVAELFNGQLSAGNHTVDFDASSLSSGVYFYNFNGKNFNETKKMLLLK